MQVSSKTKHSLKAGAEIRRGTAATAQAGRAAGAAPTERVAMQRGGYAGCEDSVLTGEQPDAVADLLRRPEPRGEATRGTQVINTLWARTRSVLHGNRMDNLERLVSQMVPPFTNLIDINRKVLSPQAMTYIPRLIALTINDMPEADRKRITEGLERAVQCSSRHLNWQFDSLYHLTREIGMAAGPGYNLVLRALLDRPEIVPTHRMRDALTSRFLERDRVPFHDVRPLVEGALGKPIGEVFDEATIRPDASGPLVQNYLAVRRSTQPVGLDRGCPAQSVVIRVIKPGARAQLQRDLAAIQHFVEEHAPDDSLLRRIVADVQQQALRESDRRFGARGAARARNAYSAAQLGVPRVYPDAWANDVVVEQALPGAKLRDRDPFGNSTGGPRTYFRKVLEMVLDGPLFNVDTSYGNVLVEQQGNLEPRIAFQDWSLTAMVTPSEQASIKGLVRGIVTHDSAEVARALTALGAKCDPDTAHELANQKEAMTARFAQAGKMDLGLKRNAAAAFKAVAQASHTILEIVADPHGQPWGWENSAARIIRSAWEDYSRGAVA